MIRVCYFHETRTRSKIFFIARFVLFLSLSFSLFVSVYVAASLRRDRIHLTGAHRYSTYYCYLSHFSPVTHSVPSPRRGEFETIPWKKNTLPWLRTSERCSNVSKNLTGHTIAINRPRSRTIAISREKRWNAAADATLKVRLAESRNSYLHPWCSSLA